jgi:hypothetical protein
MVNWISTQANIDDLCERFSHSQQKVICFVGAGANIQYAPSWTQLIERLLNSAINRGIFNEEEVQSIKQIFGDDLLAIFDIIKRRADNNFISEFLIKQFPENNDVSDIYKKIIDLPFDGYITTNFDLGLSTAREAAGFRNPLTAVGSYQNGDYLNKWLNAEIFNHHKPILYCHGMVSNPDSVILGHNGFAQIYSGNSKWRKLFQHLWQNYTIVFVGFSFSDPYINVLFRHTLESTQQHFIIQPLKNENVSQGIANSYYVDSGLRPIFYNSENNHTRISEVFNELVCSFNNKCLDGTAIAFQIELENCGYLNTSVICEKLKNKYDSEFKPTLGPRPGNSFRITCNHHTFETIWMHYKQGRFTTLDGFSIVSLKPSDDQIVGLEFIPDYRITPGHPAYPNNIKVAAVFEEFLKAQYSITFPYTDKELIMLADQLAGDQAGAVICLLSGIKGMDYLIDPIKDIFKNYHTSNKKKTIVYITLTPHGYYYHSNYLRPNIENTTKGSKCINK